MSFKDTQSYKELQSDWRWIHEMDPEAAAAADQWVKEHPEEWKELEHMLYYSEANFHKRVAPDTLEDVDTPERRLPHLDRLSLISASQKSRPVYWLEVLSSISGTSPWAGTGAYLSAPTHHLCTIHR